MDDQAFQSLLEEIQRLEAPKGVDMNDMLDISDTFSKMLIWMIRKHGFQTADLAERLGISAQDCQKLMDVMQKKGLLEEVEDTQIFQLNMASARSSRKYQVPKDVWKIFD